MSSEIGGGISPDEGDSTMPEGTRAVMLAAFLVSTTFVCGCLEDDEPPEPVVELSVLGAATVPAVWNATGLVLAPPGKTFLLVKVGVTNEGQLPIAGLWGQDIQLTHGDRLVVANEFTSEVSVVNVTTSGEPIGSVMPQGGIGYIPPTCSTVVLFMGTVPDGALGDASLALANASALGKGLVATVALPWSSVAVHATAPPRLALRTDNLQYLNRTAPGEQTQTRYLVASVTVGNLWSRPFSLAPSSLRLLDAGGQSHPLEPDAPWLNGQLTAGTIAPGASRSGEVAFAVPPSAMPAWLVLDDAVPAEAVLDPNGIGYGE